MDCNIHDIDLVNWFFGADSQVKSISAVGVTAVAPGLKQWGESRLCPCLPSPGMLAGRQTHQLQRLTDLMQRTWTTASAS